MIQCWVIIRESRRRFGPSVGSFVVILFAFCFSIFLEMNLDQDFGWYGVILLPLGTRLHTVQL